MEKPRCAPSSPACHLYGGKVNVHRRSMPIFDGRAGGEAPLHGWANPAGQPQGFLLQLMLVLFGKRLIGKPHLVEYAPDIRPGKINFNRAQLLRQFNGIQVKSGCQA
ncbi:hypothetical protein [Chloracidobacterium aggregatum]|uniref:hypothetical protein n=1 Tax=Chloracidobacterium aggregatum TaxID=2851959 RepID=UPI001B8C65F5|nr:hypothetical protein [Chloracidobacterium aggregatum]QUV97121.1 hypothetical protein J8C00_01250 [Chloracidobacterium sp. E]